MNKSFFIFILLFFTSLYGDFISGFILEKDNKKPLKDVYVISKDEVKFTNKNGYFSFENLAENEKIKIYKLGFKEKIVKVDSLEKKILLEKKSLQMNTIKISEKRKLNLSDLKSVSLIKKEEIENKNKFSEVFQNRADLQLKGINLAGEKTEISLLGQKSKHTLVLIDGIPANNNGEAFDFSEIPLEIVDNIEILKNNAGTEGGSGGIAGVINIITKSNFTSENITSSFGFGSLGYQNKKISLKYNLADFSIFANSTQLFAKNNFTYNYLGEELKRENNEKKIENYNLILNYRIKDISFKFNSDTHFAKKFLPGKITDLKLYENSFNKSKIYKNRLKINYEAKKFNFQNQIYTKIQNSTFENLEAPVSYYHAQNKNYDAVFGIQSQVSFNSGKYKNRFKVSGQRETFFYKDLIREIYMIPEISRNSYSVSYLGNSVFEILPFEITNNYSIREDFIEEEAMNSLRFGSSILFRHYFDYSITGNFGSSFVVPSFYDLYWDGGIQSAGNIDLKPEKSKGYDISLMIKDSDNYISFKYYDNQIENLIYWIKRHNGWRPDNIAKAETKNFETTFQYNFLKYFNFQLNHLRTISLNKTKTSSHFNKNIVYTPTSNTKLKASFKNSFMKQEIIYSRIGRRWITLDNILENLKPYEIYNANFSLFKEFKKMKYLFSTSFNNITNEQYEISRNYPQAGFNWSLNFSIKYKI